MENNEENQTNQPNYSKILEEELNTPTELPQSSPQPDPQIPTPPKKTNKVIILLFSIIFIIFLGLAVAVIALTNQPSNPSPDNSTIEKPSGEDDDDDDDKTETFVFKMPELATEINLPSELNGKVFSSTDGENYYVWGYTGDERPDYTNESSPDFLPLFALNYSSEPFSTEEYSFDYGEGAHGRDDDERTLFFHANTKLYEFEPEYIDETEEPPKILQDFETFELYFRDGFLYRDL